MAQYRRSVLAHVHRGRTGDEVVVSGGRYKGRRFFHDASLESPPEQPLPSFFSDGRRFFR
jgi:hypothetical protein